jgi:hypothetical protein
MLFFVKLLLTLLSQLQEFFRPKHVLLVNEKRWGSDETELLYKGFEKFGVGSWHDMSMQFLPDWSDQQIRARASKVYDLT